MRALIASALAASSLWLAVPAHATWLDDSVALDAVYIPALSHSSAAQNDAVVILSVGDRVEIQYEEAADAAIQGAYSIVKK